MEIGMEINIIGNNISTNDMIIKQGRYKVGVEIALLAYSIWIFICEAE